MLLEKNGKIKWTGMNDEVFQRAKEKDYFKTF